MGRAIYQLSLYLLLGGLLALYLDSSYQLNAFRTQKETLCKDLRLAANAFPDVYATCTQNPPTLFKTIEDKL